MQFLSSRASNEWINKNHILPVLDVVATTVVCLLHVSLGASVSTVGLIGRLDLNLSKTYRAITSNQDGIYLLKANNGNTRTTKLTKKDTRTCLQPLKASENQSFSDILTHPFPMHPFSTPWKPYGFLVFQGVEKRCIGNEWVKWGMDVALMPLLLTLNIFRILLCFYCPQAAWGQFTTKIGVCFVI